MGFTPQPPPLIFYFHIIFIFYLVSVDVVAEKNERRFNRFLSFLSDRSYHLIVLCITSNYRQTWVPIREPRSIGSKIVEKSIVNSVLADNLTVELTNIGSNVPETRNTYPQ